MPFAIHGFYLGHLSQVITEASAEWNVVQVTLRQVSTKLGVAWPRENRVSKYGHM